MIVFRGNPYWFHVKLFIKVYNTFTQFRVHLDFSSILAPMAGLIMVLRNKNAEMHRENSWSLCARRDGGLHVYQALTPC